LTKINVHLGPPIMLKAPREQSEPSMTRIVSTVRIHRELSEVFDFFTTPENAPRWHPASISVAGSVDHPLAIHEEFTEELKAPIGSAHATWRVTSSDGPKLWRIHLVGSIPDVKMEASVTLRFRSEQGDTIVERDVAYRYGKPWAALCNALFLRRRNEREGNDGLRRAKKILEASPVGAARKTDVSRDSARLT
jgi:uncharacterized membrane protein